MRQLFLRIENRVAFDVAVVQAAVLFVVDDAGVERLLGLYGGPDQLAAAFLGCFPLEHRGLLSNHFTGIIPVHFKKIAAGANDVQGRIGNQDHFFFGEQFLPEVPAMFPAELFRQVVDHFCIVQQLHFALIAAHKNIPAQQRRGRPCVAGIISWLNIVVLVDGHFPITAEAENCLGTTGNATLFHAAGRSCKVGCNII